MGNQWVVLCLSAAGRLSALERVRSERFHCIATKDYESNVIYL